MSCNGYVVRKGALTTQVWGRGKLLSKRMYMYYINIYTQWQGGVVIAGTLMSLKLVRYSKSTCIVNWFVLFLHNLIFRSREKFDDYKVFNFCEGTLIIIKLCYDVKLCH